LQLAGQGLDVTIADLDVVNPYFRSREARGLSHASRGCPRKLGSINILSDHFGGNTGQDLPAISYAFLSNVKAGENVIIDLAGSPVGLRLLANCTDAISSVKYEFLCVLNLFRPETDSPEKMIELVNKLNSASLLKITGLINNGNMLHDTAKEHILTSQAAVLAAAKALKLPLRYSLLNANVYEEIKEQILSEEVLSFDKLQMRESWQ